MRGIILGYECFDLMLFLISGLNFLQLSINTHFIIKTYTN